MDLSELSAWDVAMRYHELKARASMRERSKPLRKLSAAAILERAQAVLGSVVHPAELVSCPLTDLPVPREHAELDIEESIENSSVALALGEIEERDLWMSFQRRKRYPIVLSVDTSLSMTGEKLALTAVALGVVLLQFPDDPIGIVAFENEAKVLKRPEESLSVETLIERFLDVPAQGYTHLEEGMLMSLKLVDSARRSGTSGGRPPSVVLVTDGKYTAGRDPAYLAQRFPHLNVLKMGKEKASLGLCRELAHQGRGTLREVADLDALPLAMYSLVKDLLRGSSLS